MARLEPVSQPIVGNAGAPQSSLYDDPNDLSNAYCL
jgi:hypothetical protein